MAVAKKCDICGKLYEPYNERHEVKKPNGFMFLNIDTNGKYYSNNTIDCCPECMESIKDYIKSLRKEKNE